MDNSTRTKNAEQGGGLNALSRVNHLLETWRDCKPGSHLHSPHLPESVFLTSEFQDRRCCHPPLVGGFDLGAFPPFR
jgi:hypothetical protein